MAVTDEQLQAAKLKSARATQIHITVGVDVIDVVARPATRAEWKAYKALANDASQDKAASANEQLAIFCTLVPAGNDFVALLDRYPAAADIIAGQIKELSGLSNKVERDL
jgi:hypothetical protein